MMLSKKEDKRIILGMINYLILFFTGFIFLLPNNIDTLPYIGITLIICSLCMVYKVRFDKCFLLMFSIICYVNLSIALEDFRLTESTIIYKYVYQFALRNSSVNVISAKSLLLLNSIINFFLPEMKKTATSEQKKQIICKNNSIIFYVGYLVLLYGLIYGIDRGDRLTYLSNSNALYEYCLIIFIVVWYYSGNSKIKKILLGCYGGVYIFQGFLYGDRSSMFPMCVLMVIIFSETIKLSKVFIFALLGIFATNYISMYRKEFIMPSIIEIVTKGIKADTLTASYYTSLTVIKIKDYSINVFNDFFDFIISLFTGGSFGNSNLTFVAKEYMHNGGGGMFYSYFYYWFGYAGVIILALLFSLLIRKIINTSSDYSTLLKICLTTMSFRWYIYSPTVFFRSVLIIFTILFGVCMYFDKLCKSK